MPRGFFETRSKGLEVKLERELYDARPRGRLRDAPERCRHSYVAVRVGEVRPVKEVEELRAELSAHALRERDELHNREVQVLLPGATESVARRVAERIRRVEHGVVDNPYGTARQYGARDDESRRVEISVQPVGD